jgi:predicted ArsR family transcriptional regulator
MTRDPARDLDPLAVLAEPIRRRLYEYVAVMGVPVDRDQAAEGAGVSRPLAAFHLDRLADAGLLEVQYRRRTGRTGPGAGRPAKYYLRPEDREINVSLPPRRYDLAAEILATAVEHRVDATGSVLDAARQQGERLGADASSAGPDTLTDLLAAQGYEPHVEVDGVVRLRNCPFHALVEEHRDLVCTMNLALLEGVLSRLGATSHTASLQPQAGYCCVAFIPRA